MSDIDYGVSAFLSRANLEIYSLVGRAQRDFVSSNSSHLAKRPIKLYLRFVQRPIVEDLAIGTQRTVYDWQSLQRELANCHVTVIESRGSHAAGTVALHARLALLLPFKPYWRGATLVADDFPHATADLESFMGHFDNTGALIAHNQRFPTFSLLGRMLGDGHERYGQIKLETLDIEEDAIAGVIQLLLTPTRDPCLARRLQIRNGSRITVLLLQRLIRAALATTVPITSVHSVVLEGTADGWQIPRYQREFIDSLAGYSAVNTATGMLIMGSVSAQRVGVELCPAFPFLSTPAFRHPYYIF